MIDERERLARQEDLSNVRFEQRDFMNDGTGLPNGSVEYAMLFNILHAEEPLRLLAEAWRILLPGGRVAVIHWNYDPATPRGPSMSIRPRPEDCRRWLIQAGFIVADPIINLPPHHYGLVGRKGAEA
jgi:SAM-dependent methyltransferase